MTPALPPWLDELFPIGARRRWIDVGGVRMHVAEWGPADAKAPVVERCREVVASFRGPIELVWGTRDPVLGRVLRHLERRLPAAAVTRTEAGHFLQEEVPGPIADAIRRVVVRVRADAGPGLAASPAER